MNSWSFSSLDPSWPSSTSCSSWLFPFDGLVPKSSDMQYTVQRVVVHACVVESEDVEVGHDEHEHEGVVAVVDEGINDMLEPWACE